MKFTIPRFDAITKESEDKLGFTNAAKRLITIFNNIETPNAFGIYGIWGSGKTSLMNLTREQIDKSVYAKDIATVWFEPWKYEYEKTVPIVFPLLQQIQKSLDGEPELKDFFKEKIKYLGSISLPLANIVIQKSIGVSLNSFTNDVKTASDKIYTEYEQWLKQSDNFQKEYETKLKKALRATGKKKLFIFVDDMDRCLQENVLQLLEVMKNYLSVQNTLFIFGMDRRVIIDYINNSYPSTRSYGEEYLNKIIPLSTTLPTINPVRIAEAALKNLKKGILSTAEIELIIKYLQAYCRTNRRLMQTIVNKYLIILSYVDLSQLFKELGKNADFQSIDQCRFALFRWCLIQELVPTLFENFEWERQFDKELNEWQSITAKIAHPWYNEDKNPHRLTPRLTGGIGYTLQQYINEGLFKK